MTRRPRPPHRLVRAAACLALVLAARALRSAEETHAPSAATTGHAVAHEPAPAHGPVAEAASPHAPATENATATALPAAAESHAAPAVPSGSTSAPTSPPPALVAPKVPRDEIHGLLNLGVSLTDRGDFDAAEIAYRQVLDTPTVAQNELKTALLGLARMHRRQGAATKAAAIYERFLKDYPGDERTPDALLDLGRTLRDLGVYKTAVARFYSVINSTLKLPAGGFDRYQVLAKTAQFEIAETHFQAGDFAEAAKFYTRFRLLENLAPADRARALFKSAYSQRLQGDLDGAVRTLRVFIEQSPEDENVPEARYLLAISLRDLKRPQEAFAATLELLRTVQSRVATDPKRWSYWQRRTGNQLANDFFETGDTLNAHAIYLGLLDLSPEPAWRLPISYQLGLCYERLGIADQARSFYQSVVDLSGPTPSPEFAELAKMAAWRIEHLGWRDKVGRQITEFFDSTTGNQTAVPTPNLAAKTAATP